MVSFRLSLVLQSTEQYLFFPPSIAIPHDRHDLCFAFFCTKPFGFLEVFMGGCFISENAIFGCSRFFGLALN
jgi:hypothetical protein